MSEDIRADKRKSGERGAIVAEATIALTTYIFLIFTILSMVDICYVQSKIAASLESAAKEISQYSYLYFKFGIDEYEKDLHHSTADSRKLADQTVEGLGTLMTSLQGTASGLESANFDQMYESIKTGGQTVQSLVSSYGDAIADDPKAFIIGMGKLAGEELKEEAKKLLAQVMAKALMKKNFVTSMNDTADNFLRRNRVVNGMDGLDFDYSVLMPYGSNDIVLVVTYDVRVIRLLNIDYKFTFRQCAKTKAWGNGISQVKKENNISKPVSIWNAAPMERGKKIVEKESAKLQYTTSATGIHGYSNAGGANQFIRIFSVDTTSASYRTENGIRNILNSNYNELHTGVSSLGSEITVRDQAGRTSTMDIRGNKTYKMILVVPDHADMALVQKAITQFRKSNPGVVVEVRTGYGDPEPAQNKGTARE